MTTSSPVGRKPKPQSNDQNKYVQEISPADSEKTSGAGDALAQEEKKDYAERSPHLAPDIWIELKDHILLSVLGFTIIAFALGTAIVTKYAANFGYFTTSIVILAQIAEWSLLLAGVATSIGLAVGLVFTSAVSVIQKVLLASRVLKQAFKRGQ